MRGWAKDVDYKNKFVFKDPTLYEPKEKKPKSRKPIFTLTRTNTPTTFKERSRTGSDSVTPDTGTIKRSRRQTLSARKAEEVMSVMAMSSTNRSKAPAALSSSQPSVRLSPSSSASSAEIIARSSSPRSVERDPMGDPMLRTPKEQQLFDRVVEEAIQTEKDYVRDLNLIFEVFMKPMLSKKIISDEDSASLFSNLQLLLGVNEELLRQLLEAKREYDVAISPRSTAATATTATTATTPTATAAASTSQAAESSESTASTPPSDATAATDLQRTNIGRAFLQMVRTDWPRLSRDIVYMCMHSHHQLTGRPLGRPSTWSCTVSIAATTSRRWRLSADS